LQSTNRIRRYFRKYNRVYNGYVNGSEVRKYNVVLCSVQRRLFEDIVERCSEVRPRKHFFRLFIYTHLDFYTTRTCAVHVRVRRCNVYRKVLSKVLSKVPSYSTCTCTAVHGTLYTQGMFTTRLPLVCMAELWPYECRMPLKHLF
jgi:hypothetical protein